MTLSPIQQTRSRPTSPILIEILSQPTTDVGYQPRRWPALTLDRQSPGMACVYQIDSLDPGDKISYVCSCADIAEAWSLLNASNCTEGIILLAGQHPKPIVLSTPTFHPNRWSIWQADATGQTSHVGIFRNRFSVMLVAKRIIAAGGCPVIATQYLLPDADWDASLIIKSSEVTDDRGPLSSFVDQLRLRSYGLSGREVTHEA